MGCGRVEEGEEFILNFVGSKYSDFLFYVLMDQLQGPGTQMFNYY